jgi:ferredoxin
MVRYGIPMLASSGYIASIDKNLCVNCGACRKRCPFEAITGTCEVDREKCLGCGVCLGSCRQKAIVLERDEAKGMPLDIQTL